MTWLDHYITHLECEELELKERLADVRCRLAELVTEEIEGVTIRNPDVMSGALCFHGTRIPVTTVVSASLHGWDTNRIHQAWPSLSRVAIDRVLDEYTDTLRGYLA